MNKEYEGGSYLENQENPTQYKRLCSRYPFFFLQKRELLRDQNKTKRRQARETKGPRKK
jgi:hypothetical protein